MIPNQWYPVYESRRLRKRSVALQRLGERLVLWRDDVGRAVGMRDRCPHRGVALSLGRVRAGRIECPFHGFQFDASGRCQLMPCEGPDARIPAGMEVPTYEIREAHGLVWLFWGKAREALPEIPWFDELVDRPGGGSIAKEWPINYARTIESNFDLHHTPFVHGRWTPGIGTRIDRYHVEVDGLHIKTRGELRKENASKGIPFRVEFLPPCITLLEITPKLRFVLADCPIDAHRTWRCGRYYQDYLRWPRLQNAASWLLLQLDWALFQLPQDLRVMETQDPQLPADHVDRLVAADGGTAAYQKQRRRLLAEAETTRENAGEPGAAPLREVSSGS